MASIETEYARFLEYLNEQNVGKERPPLGKLSPLEPP
ncbi:hypothetical protein RLIN73S_06786 [Rhodanobacter lindaniclasticus]